MPRLLDKLSQAVVEHAVPTIAEFFATKDRDDGLVRVRDPYCRQPDHARMLTIYLKAPPSSPRGAREPTRARFSTVWQDREPEHEPSAPARQQQSRIAPRKQPQPVVDLASEPHASTYEAQKPSAPSQMKRKKSFASGFGHRPTDTLHNRQISSSSTALPHKKQRLTGHGDQSRSTLDVTKSPAGNVQRTYLPTGSESAKRRKIDDTDKPRSHQSSPPRDLEMDERSPTQTLNPRNMGSHAKSSDRKRESSDGFTKDLFKQNELNELDKMHNQSFGKAKKSRRRRSGTESEISSHRSHYFDAASVEGDGHPNPRHKSPDDSVVVLYDSQEPQPQPKPTGRPPIDLKRGMDEREVSARHRAAARDNAAQTQLQRAPAAGSRVMRSPLESPARDERRSPQRVISGIRRTQEPDRLHNHFKRDDGKTVISTRSSPIRISPIKDSFESVDNDEDELHGETTITREILDAARESESTTPGRKARPRGGSPSDLPRTTFTQRQQQRNSTASVKKTQKAKQVSPPVRIHLKMLFWAAYVLREVDLVWLDDENAFIVETDQPYWPGPSKRIGSQTQKWISSESGRFVVLWTPADASEPSNAGRIGLKFERPEDKEVCLDKLMKTNKSLHIKVLTDETVKSMFKTLLSDSMEHQKRIPQRAAEEEQIQASAKSRVRAVPAEEEAEEILFEDAEEEETAMTREAPRPTVKDVLTPKTRDTTEKDPDDADSGKISAYFNSRETRRALRSSRNSSDLRPRAVTPPKWTVVNNPEPWQHSVVFPPLPAPRRVTVDFRDLERLDEGEFLNDNVISFALRDIEESMLPEHRKDVYMFNTFFYSSLTTRNGRKAFNYDAVKRWTNKINIFDYKYVIVPINLDLHWFVAIICNLPDLFAPEKKEIEIDDDDEETQVDETQIEPSSSNEVIPDSLGEITMAEKSSPAPSGEISRLSLEDSVPGSFPQDENASARQPMEDKKKKSKKRRSHTPRKIPNSGPIIITLDSFGHSRTAEIRHLKDYLVAEGKDKRGVELDRDRMQGVTARGIPEQPNFCDCGVYVVEYVQQFAKNPRVFVEKILNRELDKDRDFAEFQPSQRRDTLREKLIRLNKEQEAEHAERKNKRAKEKAAAAAKQKRGKEQGQGQEHEIVRKGKEEEDSPTIPVMKVDEDDEVVDEDATVAGSG